MYADRRLLHLLLLALLLLALPAAAQDDAPAQDLAETTWLSGRLRFSHPADWVVRDDTARYGAMSLATDEAALDAQTLPQGALLLQIAAPLSTVPAALDRYQVETLTPADALRVLNVSAGDPPTPFTLQGRPAARLTARTTDLDILFLTVQDANEPIIYYLFAAAPSGGLADHEADVLALAASLEPAPLPSAEGQVTPYDDAPPRTFAPQDAAAEGVVWQQLAVFDAVNAPFRTLSPFLFGPLAVTPDDEIVVATGGDALLLLDADGALRRVIRNEAVIFNDVALDPDGGYWVIDRLQNRVFGLDANGTVHTAFGRYGSGPDQFADNGPMDIAVGPDGRIYVLSSNRTGGDLYDEIQVWDREGNFIDVIPAGFIDPTPEPSLLSLASDGNLYLSRFGGALVTVFSTQGDVLAQLPVTADIFLPSALHVASAAEIYVAQDGQIARYAGAATPIARYGSPTNDADGLFAPGELFNPHGLGTLSNGDIVAADANGVFWQVVRFSQSEPDASP